MIAYTITGARYYDNCNSITYPQNPVLAFKASTLGFIWCLCNTIRALGFKVL